MAPGVGLEPTPFLLNRQAGYRLPDPGLEPTAGIAPTSPVYETGSLLLTYAGDWEGAAGAAPALAVLQTAAFADSPHAR